MQPGRITPSFFWFVFLVFQKRAKSTTLFSDTNFQTLKKVLINHDMNEEEILTVWAEWKEAVHPTQEPMQPKWPRYFFDHDREVIARAKELIKADNGGVMPAKIEKSVLKKKFADMWEKTAEIDQKPYNDRSTQCDTEWKAFCQANPDNANVKKWTATKANVKAKVSAKNQSKRVVPARKSGDNVDNEKKSKKRRTNNTKVFTLFQSF